MDPNVRGLFLLVIIIIVFVLIIEIICKFSKMSRKECIKLFIRCPQIPAAIIVATAVICNLIYMNYWDMIKTALFR